MPGHASRPVSPIWRSFASSGEAEVGDLCEGTRMVEKDAVYQRSWSNHAAAADGGPCLPAAKGPYFSMSVAQDWYSGASVTIPVTGWSTASAPDWFAVSAISLQSRITRAGADVKFTAELTGSRTEQGKDGPLVLMNNGDQATLTVTAPDGLQAGSLAVIYLLSYPRIPGGGQIPRDVDVYHIWPVGVYVQ